MSGGVHDGIKECELTRYKQELAFREKLFLTNPVPVFLNGVYVACDRVIRFGNRYADRAIPVLKRHYREKFGSGEVKPDVEDLAHYLNRVKTNERLSELAELIVIVEGVRVEKSVHTWEKRRKVAELKAQFSVADLETLQSELSGDTLENLLGKHDLTDGLPFVRHL